MAALLGCQMLSGFFSRYDPGKEAIRTLAGFRPSKTGQSCQQAVFRRATNLCLPRHWIGGARVFG
jgi:hypothetical protein